ncbi:MAG: type II 3-dehydroquinate dehydratase [Pseudomonadota bacterium]|nr:type II 3-dehydroquinate dehydratase [Pseudomonadota bacterium]
MNVLLLNGPNLNLLGQREPEKYGAQTLTEVVESLQDQAQAAGASLAHFQSNSEAELINRIHQAASDKTQAIIFNPAAYTHTSVALRDALLGVDIPFFEIHISNVYQRESFRHTSYFSDIAQGCIIGMGTFGYQLALSAAINLLTDQ